MTEISTPHPYNVLVFDSGVGGLSLVQHIRDHLPAIGVTYLADNACFPYGLLDDGALIKRVSTLIGQLHNLQQPDAIVIGCNSASTLVLPHLRRQLSTPIVGVVPAIKPAALHSQTKVIGLLATPGTIQREYTDELISEFADDCKILRVGSNQLVEAIEKKLSGINGDDSIYATIAEQFQAQPNADQLDTIVLACTHFPHAVEELKKSLPSVTTWIDSGEAIARRVSHLLNSVPVKSHTTTPSDIAYLTAPVVASIRLEKTFEHFGFERVLHWPEH